MRGMVARRIFARRLRHRWAVAGLAVFVVAASGCSSEIGAGEPLCDADVDDVPVTLITQAQAVPRARWGPCVNELPVGWDVRLHEPASGRAGFWLDSDRVGLHFADVVVVDSCAPPADARSLPGAPPGMRRLIDVEQRPAAVPVTVVPVASRHESAAFRLARDLAQRPLEGHPVSVRQTGVQRNVIEAVQTARDAGRFVVVVDDAGLQGAYELWLPGKDPELGLDLDDLRDELGEEMARPTLQATWWDVGDGACIVTTLDARGEDVSSVIGDVTNAVGAYPLSDLHDYAEELGFVLGGRPTP